MKIMNGENIVIFLDKNANIWKCIALYRWFLFLLDYWSCWTIPFPFGEMGFSEDDTQNKEERHQGATLPGRHKWWGRQYYREKSHIITTMTPKGTRSSPKPICYYQSKGNQGTLPGLDLCPFTLYYTRMIKARWHRHIHLSAWQYPCVEMWDSEIYGGFWLKLV